MRIFKHTIQYCAKVMRANFDEFRRNLTKLCDISKEANFRHYFDEKPTQLLFRYYRNFVQMREISHGISFEISSGEAKFRATFLRRGAKFRVTFHLAERNFVRHFVWWSKISCNISFGGAKLVAKVLDFTVS